MNVSLASYASIWHAAAVLAVSSRLVSAVRLDRIASSLLPISAPVAVSGGAKPRCQKLEQDLLVYRLPARPSCALGTVP
jgi:hypothetical protein